MQKNNDFSIIRAITQFTRSEITELFAQAKPIVKSDGFTLRIAPRSKEFGRILMVISKKYGSAVQRNKLRRQLRHVFYEERLYEKPYDWIMSVYETKHKKSFAQLKKMMLDALNAYILKSQ